MTHGTPLEPVFVPVGEGVGFKRGSIATEDLVVAGEGGSTVKNWLFSFLRGEWELLRVAGWPEEVSLKRAPET